MYHGKYYRESETHTLSNRINQKRNRFIDLLNLGTKCPGYSVKIVFLDKLQKTFLNKKTLSRHIDLRATMLLNVEFNIIYVTKE